MRLRRFCYVLLIVFGTAGLLVLGNVDDSSYEDYDDDDEDSTSADNNSTANSTLILVKPFPNVTVDPHVKSVKFVCEVHNLLDNNNNTNKVVFTWKINKATTKKSKRINIRGANESRGKFRSVLTVKDVELFDRGYYECSATNGIDRVRHEAVLVVQAPGGLDGPSSAVSSTAPWGGRTSTRSRFEGEITTFPSNSPPSSVFDANLVDMPDKHHLEEAIKSGRIQKTFDLTPTGRLPDGVEGPTSVKKGVKNETQPFCQIYGGKTCDKYLKSKWVFVQPPYSQEDIERMLRDAFLVISQSNDISSSCNKFAHPSLCLSAFPQCVDPHKINIYQTSKLSSRQRYSRYQGDETVINPGSIRNELGDLLMRICKDDCLLLETELCSKEYAIAKRHPVLGQTLKMEECHLLPDQVEGGRNCLGLDVDTDSVNKDDNCFWDQGEFYRGVKNVSESGRGCLRWSHQFHIHLSDHAELMGHNYCRNPGGVAQRPFCYVDQNHKEMCQISNCAYMMTLYIVAIFVAVSTAVAALVAFLCCRRRQRRKNNTNLQNMNVPTADKNIYGNPGPNSPMELNNLLPPAVPPLNSGHAHHHRGGNSSKTAYQNVPQYTYKEVTFVDELGEGAFGKVYKGELKSKTDGKIFVAVKSLKENASAKTQGDFQREIELISELKHPNIICLMGVVVKQEPMCMLFEFMSEGDLHEFLISNSPSEGKSLTQNQFLHIALQIAQGMEYLSENHYVHRDLAARNCLVSKDLVVKISDFGLSRDMYSCDYYRVQSKSLLPVRWMPPESILYGKFTTESDVWSYGVVLWEIYSYGLQPYYGYNNQEVINMIRSRKLLPCPDACPSYCYALMVECWAELSIRRPSFGEIGHRLRVWKQNGNAANGAYFRTPPPPHNHQQEQSMDQIGHRFHPQAKQQQQHYNLTGDGNVDDGRVGSSTWGERGRFHESQSSLTSRSSSLGGKTQSTSLSNGEQHRHKKRRHNDSLDRDRERRSDFDRGLNSLPKNTVVNSNGENFEIKITQ